MEPDKPSPLWGIVSTIKADARTVLNFAAYHLDLGAHRLHIYLDEPNPDAFSHLKAHPKIRVQTCDSTYWKQRKKQRPAKHQTRQTLNATHAYERIQTDWVAHIDADEFISPPGRLSDALAAVPDSALCARIRPIEALPGREGHYKSLIPDGPGREAAVRALYPSFGVFLKGGFLSHVAGKVFARTGLPDIQLRIHNLYQGGEIVPGAFDLDQVDLCHHHADSWEQWQTLYKFRLERGSYRPGLAPGFPRLAGGLSKHELLTLIEEEHGPEGLRRFFDEISAKDPEVFQKLEAQGLLKIRHLELDAKRQKHFPRFG